MKGLNVLCFMIGLMIGIVVTGMAWNGLLMEANRKLQAVDADRNRIVREQEKFLEDLQSIQRQKDALRR